MIGTRGIIFKEIIFYLTFRYAYSIFTVILAGFFPASIRDAVRNCIFIVVRFMF